MSAKYNFTCEGCPMQAEGEVFGYEWYFRARGAGWSFIVAKEIYKTPYIFSCDGEYDDNEKSGLGAGWMPKDKCEMLIDKCLELYLVARPDLAGHVVERTNL